MAKKTLTPEEFAKFSSVGRSNVRTSKVHERRVAHLLTDWSGVEFRRRRVEGRDLATRVVQSVADVIATAGDFHFTVECKKGQGFSFDHLMAAPATSLFTEWWFQACYDASLVSSDTNRKIYPMMFFKPLPTYDWVAFSARAIGILRPKHNVPDTMRVAMWFPCLYFNWFANLGQVKGSISHSKKNPKWHHMDLDPVVICRWRDFAEHVDPVSAFHVFPQPLPTSGV